MSDPSAINLPVHIALTSDMMLGLKPSAPKSRSYRLSVPAMNASTFAPGAQVIIELPTGRRGTWLDQSQSYLKFSVQATSTAACAIGGTGVYIDNSAYSFIQRLDIYNSSNLLETINEYGQTCNFLMDTSLTQSDKAGLSSILGTNSIGISLSQNATYVQYSLQAALSTAGDRSGMSLATATTAAGFNAAIPYTFCLPLCSGVVGINASKMLPVGKIVAPIRMEFYLSQNDDAIYYGSAAAGAAWQISNVEFVACYVELQDDNYDQSSAGIPEYISTSTFRQASTYLPATSAGDFTFLLPFRCASLTGLYGRFRNYVSAVQGVNATAAYRKGSSINPNFQSFYFRIGSAVYPNKPIYLVNQGTVGTGAEAYAELLKSFHALASSSGNSCLTNYQYNVAATPNQGWTQNNVPGSKIQNLTDTANNAFMIGLECQTISNRNDTILSGISTLNSQVFFTGTIQTGATAGGANNYNYTCDFFSSMDMILILENGILSAKF
jgi:hypothetical protein